MARKKSAEISQASTPETAASAAVPQKARVPRPNAPAVTHKHKKTPTPAVNEVAVAPPQAYLAPTVQPATHDEIAIRAYFIAESRAFQGGCPEDDWFQAERELAAERGTE